MEDTLPIALGITALGMTLLFLALGLFYGLLALLTAVVRDRSAGGDVADGALALDAARAQHDDMRLARLRAAAIAVAMARAEVEAGSAARNPEGGEGVAGGGWWALHHGKRLAGPSSPWRRR